MNQSVIDIQGITKTYVNGKLTVPVLHGIDLQVQKGDFVSIMGPSGSGKSTFMNILGCLDRPTSGSYRLNGNEVANLSDDELAYVRNKEIGFVFQSFNLLTKLTAIENVALPMVYAGIDKKTRTARAEALLTSVGLGDRMDHLPAELSGGQRQRVVIAMALTREPKLLIADEPTTALDVTVQAEVVKLLNELREKLGFAMVFVSHDLALVAQLAHHITVMYAGQVVEMAPTSLLLANPTHEYTRGLLGSVLSTEVRAKRLYQIPGSVPSPYDFAVGDRFASRSLRPDANPDQKLILTVEGEPSHLWASHLAEPVTEAKGA